MSTEEMNACTENLLAMISGKKTTRDMLVPEYAISIRVHRDFGDVGEVNRAIIKRWSYGALDYIKVKAWKIVEQEDAIISKIRAMMKKKLDDYVRTHPNSHSKTDVKQLFLDVAEQAFDEGLILATDPPKFDIVRNKDNPNALDIVPRDAESIKYFKLYFGA